MENEEIQANELERITDVEPIDAIEIAEPGQEPEEEGFKPPILPFDPIRLILAMFRRSYWAAGVGLILAAGFFVLGKKLFDPSYSASIQLIRKEFPQVTSAGGTAFKPQELSIETVQAIMRSRPLLTEVSYGAEVEITPSQLRGNMRIAIERKTDLMLVTLTTGHGLGATVKLINDFGEALIRHLGEIQTREARDLITILQTQISNAEREIRTIDSQLQQFSAEERYLSGEKQVESYLSQLADVSLKLEEARSQFTALGLQITNKQTALMSQNPVATQLKAEREKLTALLQDYTDENPLVIAQQARVGEVEAAMQASLENPPAETELTGTLIGNSLYLDLLSLRANREALQTEIPDLESFRSNIETNLFSLPKKAQQYASIETRRQALAELVSGLRARLREAELFANNPFRNFEIYSKANELSAETHGTGKKVLVVAILGFAMGAGMTLALIVGLDIADRRAISPSDIRRVTGLPTFLGLAPLKTYSDARLDEWAIKAWNALRDQLLQTEKERLVIYLTSSRDDDGRTTWIELLSKSATDCALPILCISNGPTPPGFSQEIPLCRALENPQGLRTLMSSGRPESIHASWDSNADWEHATPAKLRRLVEHGLALGLEACLVELPSLESPNTLTLCRDLPNVLWLVRSASMKSTEARRDRQRLDAVGAQLRGAVINRQPRVFNRIPDLSKFGLMVPLLLSLGSSVTAQEPESTPAVELPEGEPPVEPAALQARAPWQERYELGPGDALDIWVYGRSEYIRRNVMIQPDGRLTFTYVNDLQAAGLTVDELRDRINEELSAYMTHARVIVVPVAYGSKKYVVLGTVQDSGAYVLDRPTTIVEAIAKARGLQTGLFNRNTVDLADLGRSLLIRGGQRMPVDFEKLFNEGDLSQNHYLQPGDYLYFPSSSVNQVYLVGEVTNPGSIGVSNNTTVVSIITTQGGFTDQAFRERILVIRGSLNEPEVHVVNLKRILSGREKDFKLLPRDIVFVAKEPWSITEELVDIAVRAFLISATAEWTGANIQLIRDAFIPGESNRR